MNFLGPKPIKTQKNNVALFNKRAMTHEPWPYPSLQAIKDLFRINFEVLNVKKE